MRKFSAIMLWLILFIGALYVAFAQEQMTLTTYYPAPYGVYRQLRLFPVAGAPGTCDADNEGAMYFDSIRDEVLVCADIGSGFDWAASSGGLWEALGNDIYNTNTGNVGIGTSSPGAKLEVAGGGNIRLYAGTDPGDLVFRNSAGERARIYADSAGNEILNISTGTNVDPEIIINASGNVGIGTLIDPPARLTINATNGADLTGGAFSPAFRTMSGILGSPIGSSLTLASIGFSSSSYYGALGMRAYRISSSGDYHSSVVGLCYDTNATAHAGGGVWFYSNGRAAIGGYNAIVPQYNVQLNGDVQIRSGQFHLQGPPVERDRAGVAGTTSFTLECPPGSGEVVTGINGSYTGSTINEIAIVCEKL